MNRRDFAESIATAALLPLLGSRAAPLAPGWWERVAGAGVPEPVADDLDALATALASAIRVQYGSRLGEADLAAVTRQIRSALDRARQMRQVELANGAEPDFVFAARGGTGR